MFELALLATAIGTLLITPLFLRFARAHRWLPFLDGFALVGVSGIAALHLLPESFEYGGLMSGLWFLLGLFLPTIGERIASKQVKHSSFLLVIFGVLPHILLESAALGAASEHKLTALGAAIVAHRLPVALLVYSLIETVYSSRRAWQMMFLLSLVTLMGYGLGENLGIDSHQAGLAWLNALVGGTLLHVVFAHDIKATTSSGVALARGQREPSRNTQSPCQSARSPELCGEMTARPNASNHEHNAIAPEPPPNDRMLDDHDHTSGHAHHEAHAHDPHIHTHSHCDHEHGPTSAHQPSWLHSHAHDSGNPSTRWATFGAIAGALLVSGFMFLPGGHHQGHQEPGFGDVLLALGLETAPILLMAYLFAGLLRTLIAPSHLKWLGEGNTVKKALKGVTFGLPLPICSCGVLPVYETLISRGVPASAAIGFLIATPELGLDALLISIPLLGWEMTSARLVAAFAVALLVSLFLSKYFLVPATSEPNDEMTTKAPLLTRLTSGVRFGFVELFDHTFPWVIAGLVIAAALDPMLDQTQMGHIPNWAQVPLFALIGIPIYVCASGSTPIAAIAIYNGVSPGAALAFLIAGPATNITTFGILSKLHGKKAAVLFGLGVAAGAVIFGYILNSIDIDVTQTLDPHGHEEEHLLGYASLLLVACLFVASLFRQGPRGLVKQITQPIEV